MEFGEDLLLLSELLQPNRNDDSDEDEKITDQERNNLGPKDISKPKPKKKNIYDPIEPKSEVRTEDKYDDFGNEKDVGITSNEWRQTPQWDISYRQQVTPNDVYLQMGGKNPSTASCENMIIKINLPGESRPNIDLKVLKERLEVTSPKFYLGIPLPHPVNPQLGNAKFDADTDHLIVTLVLDREFDFINF